MANDLWSGAEYWENGKDADIPVATRRLVQSIRSGVSVRFATVAARNSATAAALAAIGNPSEPYAEAPMFAVVDDLGACVYDGNADSGTGGWRWIGGARTMLDVGPLANSSTPGGPVAIGDEGGYYFDTASGSQFRLIRITTASRLRGSAGSPLTTLSQAVVYTRLDNTELGEITLSAVLHPTGGVGSATVIDPAAAEHRNASWIYRLSGSHQLKLVVSMPVHGAGAAIAELTTMQVHDLGPAY